MKQLSTVLMALILTILLSGCGGSRHSKSLSDVADQLTQQFRRRYDSVQPPATRRLKSVKIESFNFPSGNPYLGVAMVYDDALIFTSLPMVQLGDGLFGVSYRDDVAKVNVPAIISFR